MVVYCEWCSTSYPTRQEFEQALVNFFGLESDMKAFLDSFQSGSRTYFSCPNCDGEFLTLKGLKQHIGKVHDVSDKTYACSKCDKSYKTKYALRAHDKQVHSLATRVPCPICHRLLYNKYQLREHLHLHSPSHPNK